MLLLALAAQSMQELVKVVFAIKDLTTRRALEGLLTEAARAENKPPPSPDLVERVVGRAPRIGQNTPARCAPRRGADPPTLHIDPRRVAGTRTLPSDAARAARRRIAAHAEERFPVA